jgi:hypothetical protein
MYRKTPQLIFLAHTLAAAFIRRALVASGLPHSSHASPPRFSPPPGLDLELASRRKKVPKLAHASSAPWRRKSHGGLLTTSAAAKAGAAGAAKPAAAAKAADDGPFAAAAKAAADGPAAAAVMGVQSLASPWWKLTSFNTPAMAASLRANATAAGCQSFAHT